MEPWAHSLLEHWYIAPNNDEARERVVQFDRDIHNLVYKECHPLLRGTLEEQHAVHPDSNKLQSWCTPHVQTQLRVDVDKDLDPVVDKDKIAFLKEIRTTFLQYIRSMIATGDLSLPQCLEMFELVNKFKVLFDMEQYGLRGLWKAILRKLIVLVRIGNSEFLLFLFEWVPHMFTKDHCLMCEGLEDDEEFLCTMTTVCRSSPFMESLYEKHRHKFELYFK